MKERTTEKKAKLFTAALVLTGILLPVLAMFLMMRTEVIWLAGVLGAAEIAAGAVICARLSDESESDDFELESYL